MVEVCRETQAPILTCTGYEELGEAKDMDNDKDLIAHFSQVVKLWLDDDIDDFYW